MQQLTREQAINFAETESWKALTHMQRATFQLHQERLCMPFEEFHKAVEVALGHPVWTHEFARPDHLLKELLGDRPVPTLSEIMALIPEADRPKG